eukprot:1389339-Amorphochlora_amoeboformis.AAC.3
MPPPPPPPPPPSCDLIAVKLHKPPRQHLLLEEPEAFNVLQRTGRFIRGSISGQTRFEAQ